MRFLIILVLLLLPVTARAQSTPPATLLADTVRIEGSDILIAEGNVEVLYNGERLRARQIIYDQRTDVLQIQGPLVLTTDDDTVLIADSAELDPTLTNGVLNSARVVLSQQLQMAAAEMHRVDGRYTVLDKTVASSCQVCENNPVPLWQIRARRIIHDQQEKQIYFDHARFEVVGVPIAYIPRLRLPDPTLKRATGFLAPSYRSSSELGFGIKIPYFVTLGDHADITFTPYLAASRTRTLEVRYRQAFQNGDIEFNGAVSRDDIRKGETRSYVFGKGTFNIQRGYKLRFNLEAVSDRAYLLDYDFSGKDRLTSSIGVDRTQRNEFIQAEILHIRSLRDSESNRTLPTRVARLTFDKGFYPASIGGKLDLRLEALAFSRTSEDDIVGRDIGRASARLDWQRQWTIANGMQFATLTQLNAEVYSINDDTTLDDPLTRFTPVVATQFSWPHSRTTTTGVVHTLSPVAQLAWSDESGDDIPNEDSLTVELDEANLFALDRFPGVDANEVGLRANLGVNWTRYDPAGWNMGLTVGRVFYEDDKRQFIEDSGLDGDRSDWVASFQLKTFNNLTLMNRALFDDSFSFTRDELRIGWRTEKLSLSSSYVWQRANLSEGRPNNASEWVFAGGYQFRPQWRGSASWRYDFARERARRIGLGLQYQNECVKVDLSVSRRFTSSSRVDPSTNFGLSVALNGFGTSPGGETFKRSCRR